MTPEAGSDRSFKARWSSIDSSEDPRAFVQFMDRFRPPELDSAAAYRGAFALLAVQPGERILDLGCGTGGAVRALAALAGATGMAVGIDNSATMIAEAQRRSSDAPGRCDYRVADARALPFEAGSFDGCFSSGSLEIMDDPPLVLSELARVTRPGGRLVFTGTDVGTWALDAADRELTRRLLNFICDEERNGWLGRQLPRLLGECGLIDVDLVPEGRINTDFEQVSQLYLRPHLDRARRAGVLTDAEAAAWLADQAARAARGHFLLASIVFLVRGVKP